MDNLKYYNESLAYDFEMFMPKTNTAPKKKDNIVVMPKLLLKQKNAVLRQLKAFQRRYHFLCAQ